MLALLLGADVVAAVGIPTSPIASKLFEPSLPPFGHIVNSTMSLLLLLVSQGSSGTIQLKPGTSLQQDPYS